MKVSDEEFSNLGVRWFCAAGIDNGLPAIGLLWVCYEKFLQLVEFVTIVVGKPATPWKCS